MEGDKKLCIASIMQKLSFCPPRDKKAAAALKTRLGLLLAKTTAMRVLINATCCPAPVPDRTSMK